MRIMLNAFLAILISLAITFCKSNEEDASLDPVNLQFDVTIATDGSGSVDIIATADNTVRYEFYPGDNVTVDPISNENGVFSYTYSTSGAYLVEIRAYGQSGRYLKKEKQLIVEIGNGPINGEDGYITPLSYEGMNLVWNDEFSGTGLNETYWNYEIGGGGWGNNELEYYRKENTSVSEGYLVIEARKENFDTRNYTSSRLTTQNKFTFKYGRVDIRAILPKGQGIWPALWMLGQNISSVGWPACGETDIMEMIGGSGREKTVYGTLHWDNNGSHACTCDQNNSYTLSSGIFADEFHVFSIIWDSNTIKWYVDDNLFKTVDITPSGLSEFHANFFFIFNVAVGGNWPGSPDATTVFPQRMVVDYIRVFQNQ